MRSLTIVRLPVLISCAALLGGCGDSGASADRAGDTTRGVIASASDCVSFGPGAVDACARAIERAVASHEASTTVYSNLATCEEAIGEGMCERAASGKYRPRLSAFLVTLGAAARAEPLYPAKAGTVGFQTSNKTSLLASDQSLAFSRLALSVAETQAGPAGKKGRSRASSRF